VLLGACETKLPDPPPAARNQELPLAPPGARGAHAASLDPPAVPAEPIFEDPEEPLEETEPDAAPVPQSEAPDAGVAL